MNKKLKIISITIYFLIAPLCFIGIFFNAIKSNHPIISFDENILPVYDCHKIDIDNNGNFYVGSSEFSIIQVYDSNGSFKYKINVPSNSGGFEFYIDSSDYINIRTHRNNKEFIIKNKKIIESNKSNKLNENHLKTNEIEYKLNLQKNITIYKNNKLIDTVTLEKAYLPLSVLHYALIIGLGLLFLFFIYRKELIVFYKKNRK